MNIIIIVFTTIIVTIVVTLIVLNVLFNRKLKSFQTSQIDINNILCTQISYDKYKVISARTSIRNSPVRKNGDFLDFILPFVNVESGAVENKLACLDCGEAYE